MKIKWTQNLGLKIGSLVFAAFLWVFVTNYNDPITSKSFTNISVQLVNTNLLSAESKVYEVLEGTDIISRVTVWDHTSVLGRVSRDNIVATADLADLSSLDTIGIKLSVNNVETIYRIEGNLDIVKLKIEEEKTRTLPVRAGTTGTVAEGYILGDITTDQNVVRFTGPESLVDLVASAAANTDVSQSTGDISTETEIVLYDSAGNKVESERIEQNIREVQVKIQVLETKRIPVRYAVTGMPAAGYQATGITEGSLTHLIVAGRGSIVNGFSSIQIPETMLDISGSTENFVKEVDLLQFLPEGIRLVDNTVNTITVTAYIEAEASKTITLRENRVRIVNLPEGFTGSFSGLEEEVIVTLIGLQSNLDLVRENEVYGEIDILKFMEQRNVEELEEGFYTTEVDLGLGPDIVIEEPVEVLLHVLPEEEE